MAKTKNGRLMNPTDAFRKEQRRKQVNRNRLERKLQREAHSKINNAGALKDELTSILHAEENGTLNRNLRLRKKVVQDAYDHALKKQKETELKTQNTTETETETLESELPVPPPPPLPPGLPPTQAHLQEPGYGLLPPPPGPPPAFALPPPPGPPPGAAAPFPRMFPVPMQSLHVIPMAPMPKNHYTPPPKPMRSSAKELKSTIEAATTVKKRPLAQNDKSVTSMVPASVRVKREHAQTKTKGGSVRRPDLAPSLGSSNEDPDPKSTTRTVTTQSEKSQTTMEQKMSAFLSEVEELGAFD